MQRTTTLYDFVEFPERYGYDKRAVQSILMQQVTLMHRLFDDHKQALRAFQKLNNGTRLTTFELLHGILLYTDGYELKWKPLIDKIEQCIDGRWQLFKGKKTIDVKQGHMHKRHNLAVLYRFLSEDAEMTAYNDVRRTEMPVDAAEKTNYIEARLSQLLLKLEREIGYDEIVRRTNLCCQWIEQTSGDLALWRDEVLGSGRNLSPGLFRWILDVSIWRRFNNIPVPVWKKFICELLRVSDGETQFQTPHPDRPEEIQQTTINLTAVATIRRLAPIFGVSELINREPRKRVRRRSIVGVDDGHLLSFRDNGNGPTMPQSRSVNRSMGVVPMFSEEEDVLA